HFGGRKVHPHRLENHLGRILPRLRPEAHAGEGFRSYSTHAAVDVGEAASVKEIEDPGRERCSEVAVEPRHGARLDRAAKARAHHELIPATELIHEWTEAAEVVGAVSVAHDDVAPADVREGVDVCASEATPRSLQHPGPASEREVGGAVGRAVDDEYLA